MDGLRRFAAFNCRIEGRECARARAPAVVLGANWLGLPSVSDANPNRFGHQREKGAADAPTTSTSLPSMRQLNAAQRR